MPVLTITNLGQQTIATRGTFGPLGPYEQRSKSMTVSEIEQLRPLLIAMEQSGVISWDTGGYTQTDGDAEFVTYEDAGQLGALDLYEEGVLEGTFPTLNFRGSNATLVSPSAQVPGAVDITVTAPTRTASFVVGNSPAGDTLAVCDFLDPGDGSGVEAAINAINTSPVGGSIFIRRGTYNFGAGSVAMPMFLFAPNVVLRGEGSSTQLVVSPLFRNLLSFFSTGPSVQDLDILVSSPSAGAFGTTVVDIGFASGFKMQGVRITGNPTNVNESLTSFVSASFATTTSIRSCFFSAAASATTAFSPIRLQIFFGVLSDTYVFHNSGTAMVLGGNAFSLLNVSGSAKTVISSAFGYSQCSVMGGSWTSNNVGTPAIAFDVNGTGNVYSGIQVTANGSTAGSIGFRLGNSSAAGTVINGVNLIGGFSTGFSIQAGSSDCVITGCQVRNFAASTPILNSGAGTLADPANNIFI